VTKIHRHIGEIVGRHNDIAVGDYDGLVPRDGLHIDEIRDFGIGAVAVRIDDQFQIAVWKIGDQATHDGTSRIGRIGEAEHDLHRRGIILPAETCEIRVEIGLRPVQRL